jgi:hypothetical protein
MHDNAGLIPGPPARSNRSRLAYFAVDTTMIVPIAIMQTI